MVNCYLTGNDPVHDRVITAFYEGCPAEKKLLKLSEYQPSEVAVIFGVYKSRVPRSFPRGEVFRQQRTKNLDVIVLETGYINRGDGETHHYAAGFNGLNGRADFKNKGMSDDRAKKLGVELKPWREQGNHIVLCAQVPWDASVDHTDHLAWLKSTASIISGISGRQRVFRPHPLAKLGPIPGWDYSTEPLTVDLQNAHCVVTFNSNSAVEAVIEGIPVFAFDKGSMATAVANNDWDHLKEPQTPDRAQWLSDLAYCQWTLEEMRSGEAWKHLFR